MSRRILNRLIPAFVLMFALLLGACAKQAPKPKEPPKEYSLRGVVKSLDAKNQLAKVDHEKIEGWMEAMTMEYPVKNPEDFSKLKVGDKIEAKVIVQDLDYWLADIKAIPTGTAQTDAPPKADSKK